MIKFNACWVQCALSRSTGELWVFFADTCTRTYLPNRLCFHRMPPLKSYVTWNNKGGVGKTTLTFHMATQYALDHRDKNVLVVDLCPQANVSSALLQGRKKVARLTSQRKTVSFYLHQVSSSNNLSTVNLPAFLTLVSGFNNQIPPNVYLLCGDIHLQTVARSLEQKRNANLADDSAWVFVTSSVRYFIEGHSYKYAGKSSFTPGVACQPGDNKECMSFAALKRAFNNNRQVFQQNLRLINAEQYFGDIGDFHTAGIVALHYGCPLAKLKDIYSSLTQVPFVYGTVALNSQQIDIHLQCLRDLVAKL